MRISRLVRMIGSVLVVFAVAWAPATAFAATTGVPATPAGDAPVTTLEEQPEGGGIIPRPDSGAEPQDAGDRGGALQTVLFVVVIGGVVLIGALVVRESRRARAERGF